MKHLFTAILIAFVFALAAPQAAKAVESGASVDSKASTTATAPATTSNYSNMAPAAGGDEPAGKAMDNAMSKDKAADTAKSEHKGKKHHAKKPAAHKTSKKHHKKGEEKKADEPAADTGK